MNTKQYLGALLVLMFSGFLGGAVTTSLQGKAAMAATSARVISAQKIRLVDSTGKIRAFFGISHNEPALVMIDKNGKARISLALIGNHQTALELFDEKGKTRCILGIVKNEPALWLDDKNGKTRVSLDLVKNEPDLSLYDENGYVIWGSP